MTQQRDPRFLHRAFVEVWLEDKPSDQEGPPGFSEIAGRFGDLVAVGGREEGDSLIIYYEGRVTQQAVADLKAALEAAGYGVERLEWGNPER